MRTKTIYNPFNPNWINYFQKVLKELILDQELNGLKWVTRLHGGKVKQKTKSTSQIKCY